MFQKAETIYQKVGLKPIAHCFHINDAEIPTNASILIHNMLMSVCDLENRRKVRKPINVPYNFGMNLESYIHTKTKSIFLFKTKF